MSGTSARILSLLSLLQVRREWSGAELAERLTVSERTVRRYIEKLREMGYAVRATTGPEGGYQLQPGASVPPLVFDDEQAIAVAVALQTVQPQVAGLQEDAARALAAIRQVLPSRLRARVDAFDVVTLGTSRRPRPEVSTADLEAIGLAIRRQERLRFAYSRDEAPAAEPQRREIEATHLVTWSGKWYVVGWDPSRDDWRVFRVDRMRVKVPNGGRYVPRKVPGGVSDFLESRFYVQGWVVRGTALLQAPPAQVLPWVGDASGVVEPVGETASRLTAGSWSWVALVGWFSMFDCPLTFEGPPELLAARDELVSRLGKA